jgi:hypothetical protein
MYNKKNKFCKYLLGLKRHHKEIKFKIQPSNRILEIIIVFLVIYYITAGIE